MPVAPRIFQHVALTGHPQLRRIYADPTGDEPVAPAFLKTGVVGVFVEKGAVNGAEILRPLVLDMDESPLAAAKGKVLQAGQLEEVLLRIDYPIRVQVTPAGRFSSSTLRV